MFITTFIATVKRTKFPMALIALCVLCWVVVQCGCTPKEVASSADWTITHAADQNFAVECGTVIRAVDGDTLHVEVDGEEEVVRLIGIDAPESVSSDTSKNCKEGVMASNYVKSLVATGQTVWMTKDISEVDQYGRLLRYVWLENPTNEMTEEQIAEAMLNAVLVKDGYAQAKDYKPDTAYHEILTRLGAEASAAGVGVTYYWA